MTTKQFPRPSAACLARLTCDTASIATLEFALILPILLLVFFGTIEIAMTLFIASTIESAVAVRNEPS